MTADVMLLSHPPRMSCDKLQGISFLHNCALVGCFFDTVADLDDLKDLKKSKLNLLENVV